MNAEVTLLSRVRVADDVLFRDLGDDVVLLDLRSGVYFSLDPVGARVWHLLDRAPVLREIVGSLIDEYDVTEARCAADLVRLVTEMRERGLVEVSDATSA